MEDKKERVEEVVTKEVEYQIEHIEQRVNKEIEQHILPPIAEGISCILNGIFNSPYDSIEEAKYCSDQRPNPLIPISLINKGKRVLIVGLQKQPKYMLERVKFIPDLISTEFIFIDLKSCLDWVKANVEHRY